MSKKQDNEEQAKKDKEVAKNKKINNKELDDCQRAKVTVFGDEYLIKAEEPKEYIKNIAKFVNQEIDLVSKQLKNKLNRVKIMVLASMKITDKYYKIQMENNKLNNNLKKEEAKLREMKSKNEDLLNKYNELQANYNDLSEEYTAFLEEFDSDEGD